MLWTETNFSVCWSMVKMEVAGSAIFVTPEALRMEKVGRAVDTTVTVALDLGGGRSTGTTPPFSGFVQISNHRVPDPGDSLGELCRERFDGLDGYDRRVGVELER